MRVQYLPSRPSIDGLVSDFRIFGPVRNQPAPQSVQGTLLGFWVASDRKDILSWSDIPTDRQIPLGRYWDDTGEPWFFDSVRTGVNFGSDPPPEIGVPRSTDF